MPRLASTHHRAGSDVLRESGNASPEGYGGRIVFKTSCVCVSRGRSISKTEMPRNAYSEKESSLGLGNATVFMTAAILMSAIGLAVIRSRWFMAQSPPTEQRFAVCLRVGDKPS